MFICNEKLPELTDLLAPSLPWKQIRNDTETSPHLRFNQHNRHDTWKLFCRSIKYQTAIYNLTSTTVNHYRLHD